MALFVAMTMMAPAPAHAALDLDDFTQVAGGKNHTVALKPDGSVWTWGNDSNGQLGDDATLANQATPVRVPGLSEVRQIAAGDSYTVAVKADGSVWTWGADGYGQLGDDATLADKATPVQVSGLTGVRQVSAGSHHAVAVRADGSAWSWGRDNYGQLGDSAPAADKPTPVQVAGLAGVRQVSAGGWHSLALKADGTVWAWGWDFNGQLGDGGTTGGSEGTPVQVTTLAGVRHVTAGFGHSAAVISDGTARAWGRDNWGQLGDDATLANQAAPVPVAGVTGLREITGGLWHTVAIALDGTVWTWGRDNFGQLGDDATLADKATPVQVPALSGVRQLTAGHDHTVAVDGAGAVRTWGLDSSGQLGDDATLASKSTPVTAACSEACGFIQVAAGGAHTVGVRGDGTVWAWGSDASGQLGDDSTLAGQAKPVQVAGFTDARQVAAGATHTVALKTDGTVWTWGSDAAGQLGDGTALANKATPVQVAGLTGVRQVAAGGSHTVAVMANGTVRTWGSDTDGQLGDDTALASKGTPVQVAGLTGVRQVAAGGSHTVAVKTDGVGWAWGNDAYGQLGDDAALANKATPVQIAGLSDVRQVATGLLHTIALKADGTVWAWGRDDTGQLGDDAALAGKTTPVQVTALTGIRHVAVGSNHSAAVSVGGTAWSWGSDAYGQLGDDAALVDKPTPVQVASLAGMHQVAGGGDHSVGTKANGTVQAWGRDSSGQLGDDTVLADKATSVGTAVPCGSPPGIPTHLSPLTGTASAMPTLVASAFVDGDGDAHVASQWQVRTDAGTYAPPLADSGVSATSLTSWPVPIALTAGSAYWFHVRYQDATGLWSSWSAETTFVYDPNAPLDATLVSPTNGAATRSARLTATYLDSAPASSGRVEFQVCTASACTTVLETGFSPVVASGANGSWSHARTTGSYWWRARSVDASGTAGAWTAAWTFSFAQPPATPSLITPTNGAWVTTTTPTLTASYSDPDGDAGANVFEWCRADAGVADWSDTANCVTGYGSVTSASGANRVNKSAVPGVALGQGDWYWRAASRDSGGGISAYSSAWLVRVDSLPPTSLTGVSIQRSGLGKITASWNAAADAGVGGVTYDMEWSTDGAAWNSVCSSITTLTCQKSGLAGSSLPFVRVRACDSLGTCTAWQGRVGGSAAGYYLRTSSNSSVLTNTANRQATTASGTADKTTAQRIDSGETGWMQVKPATLSSVNPVASEPASIPAPTTGAGWIVDSTAGASIAVGAWTATVTTEASTGAGAARLQCRAWIVTVDGGSVTASSNYQAAYTDATDIYELGSQTSTCTLPGLAAQTTLASNQHVYLELYVNATAGPSTQNERLFVWAEGTGSALSIPPPGTAPNLPTITSPASGLLTDPTVDMVATYSHPVGATQGALEYEFATDAAFTNVVRSGSSGLLSSPSTPMITTDAIPAGTYFWRVRAADTSSLVSAWTPNRTITVSSEPAAPSNTTPAHEGSTTLTTPPLVASAFSDVDTSLGDAHTASQWQLAVNGTDFATGQDSGITAADLTSWTAPTALTPGTTYWWRVRYRDNHGQWSPYSTPTRFSVSSGGSTTLSLDTGSINMGLLTPNTDRFATFTATVTTTSPTGYSLTATGATPGSNATVCNGCSVPLADWTGTDATPTTWGIGAAGDNGYFGLTVRGTSTARLGKWGTGNNWAESDVTNNRYAAVTAGTLTLHTAGAATSDTITVTLRATSSTATSPGTHQETVTVTSTANP